MHFVDLNLLLFCSKPVVPDVIYFFSKQASKHLNYRVCYLIWKFCSFEEVDYVNLTQWDAYY